MTKGDMMVFAHYIFLLLNLLLIRYQNCFISLLNKITNIHKYQNRMSTSCKQCEQLTKKINILTSDYEFQIKKIQQDKSTEKALYEIHLQKQIRKWQQSYQQEKAAREQQNQQWLTKYDETVQKNAQQMLKYKHDSQNLLHSTRQKLIEQSTTKYDNMMNEYILKIKKMKQTHEANEKETKEKNHKQVTELIKKHDLAFETLRKSHSSQMDTKVKQYEGVILGKESEMKTELNLHQKTRNQAKQVQAKLYEQIYNKKRTIVQMQGSIKSLNDNLSQRKKQIIEKDKAIYELEQKNIKDQEQQQQMHRQKLKNIEESTKEKIKSIYKDTLNYCNKYKQALTNIESTRENEKELYLSNIEQIELAVENRASRLQDLEEIQNLKYNLAKKTKDCECLMEQLKYYRLQLENKEQTYNKIFVPISGVANENSNSVVGKRKQFKLRRAGRSVTTVREILQSVNSGNNLHDKKVPYQKSKIL